MQRRIAGRQNLIGLTNDSMQQTNIHILCTRPLPGWLIQEAAEAGIDIAVIPFIQTEAIQTVEVQQEIENALLQSATVVFTSMNAVEAVAAELEGHKPDWQIYCIGTATTKLAVQYFGEAALANTAADAAALANLMIEEGVDDEVIFFCGDKRRDELPDILQDGGIAVNEIVVYQTIELPNVIEEAYHGILFFSPSAVRSFFRKNKPAAATVLFAIGSTTAAEIKKISNNKIVISDEPGKENLVQRMIEYFTT
ncbi:MAG TPA: uroporphyrinogen-III synthase [Ferruginibacter sp.]|nr:uroporphyrinogen-III synthase [Ferruginibacter sp.]HMP22451.1 uroporphyrinogen-III synthase [Ferruginibacter sp.]